MMLWDSDSSGCGAAGGPLSLWMADNVAPCLNITGMIYAARFFFCVTSSVLPCIPTNPPFFLTSVGLSEASSICLVLFINIQAVGGHEAPVPRLIAAKVV